MFISEWKISRRLEEGYSVKLKFALVHSCAKELSQVAIYQWIAIEKFA